ncbi:TetR/AcrR family transcriptional regulator [Thalassospira sp. TSL5-1]|uniref:TetR/AcrR family transcriptional regulator n=1 Tax=Thalassospira sp. TSL5-1 TaxID=1544451 RepID=UPI00093F3938|nr:TetR/AcrR family transcriptional regulator [Thalassospira sp. TSL5-1]OKH88358.1 TetR family transcriptional regulator [Thalassospira sp. TSL5-1]
MSETKKIDPRTEKRREAIIEAARELFCEYGLSGTTLEMIIAEAGGSRRTIYELFGNKDGIFEAVIRNCTARITQIMRDLPLSEKPLRDTLIEFGENLMTALTRTDTLRYLRMFLSEVPRFPHLGKVFYESGMMTGRRLLTEYFTQQIKLGRFPDHDPEQAARFLVSLIKSDYDFRQLTYVGWEPSAGDLKQHVTLAVDMFLAGYGQGKPIAEQRRPS